MNNEDEQICEECSEVMNDGICENCEEEEVDE